MVAPMHAVPPERAYQFSAVSVDHIVVHRDGEILETAAEFELLKHATAHRPEPDDAADVAIARHLLHDNGLNATAPQRRSNREPRNSTANDEDPRHSGRRFLFRCFQPLHPNDSAAHLTNLTSLPKGISRRAPSTLCSFNRVGRRPVTSVFSARRGG